MALFPTSPTDGSQTTINGITYVYASSTNSWTRVPLAVSQVGNGNSTITFATAGGSGNVSISGTSNTVVFDPANTTFAGNLLPVSNVTYSLGTTTQRWKDLWISNSTIYIGDTALTASGNSLIVDGNSVVTTTGSSGNTTVGNIFASGYYWANGVVFGGGGGGTPGGANTYVQFNDNGVFNGTAGLTFNKTTNAVSLSGSLSAVGNITGSYIIGNGSQLTGLPAGYTDSNVSTFLAAFGSNTISTTGTITAGNVTAGNVIQAGNRVALWTTSNTTPTNSVQGDQWYAPNTDKRYLYVNDGTSNTWVDQSQTTSFSTLAVTGNTTIGANLGVTGNITTGNLTVGTGAITFGTATNAGANGTGNIGSSTGYFNTVFAKATSAQYADIAEKYSSDRPYEPGTVVVFGGEQEVTLATKPNDNSVAGVVSTNPAYIMNAGIQAAYIVQVALTGRVPTKVLGPVRKGNMMVSAGNGYAQACATPTIGTIIGKSIENFDGDQGMIEIVVGRI